MKSVSEIRLDNLETLVKEAGSADALAKASGVSPEYISQIRNRAIDKKTGQARNLGNQASRRLEAGMNKGLGWMDMVHGDAMHETGAPSRWPLPSIDEDKVRALNSIQLAQLEAAILIAAGHVGLDVAKRKKPAAV